MDPEVVAETTKTVECEVCERLVVVPDKWDVSQGTNAEIILSDNWSFTQIRFSPKDKTVICPICAAEIIISELRYFLSQEK